MTEITRTTPAARAVVAPNPARGQGPAVPSALPSAPTPTPTPAPTTREQPRASAPVEAQREAGTTAKIEPTSAAEAVSATTASNVVEALNLSAATRVTAFSDSSSGRYVIQVREAENNEVISQYPPKELLRFYSAAREALESAAERSAEADAEFEDVSA